jgi:TRAP-type C4-dicarboxylate transport system substrate-binding protein
MMTNHMQSVPSVFVNEKVWQSIPRPTARSWKTRWPKWARRHSTGIATPARSTERTSSQGMIFTEEKDGLDVEAFRKAVLTGQ